jgi:hypothetical protein
MAMHIPAIITKASARRREPVNRTRWPSPMRQARVRGTVATRATTTNTAIPRTPCVTTSIAQPVRTNARRIKRRAGYTLDCMPCGTGYLRFAGPTTLTQVWRNRRLPAMVSEHPPSPPHRHSRPRRHRATPHAPTPAGCGFPMRIFSCPVRAPRR